MGDVAVGARSGSGGEEHRGLPADVAAPAADGAVTSGYGRARAEDGTVTEHDRSGERAPGKKPEKRKPRSFWKELPVLVAVALVLALVIKTFLVQAFSIPSDSMQNTLQRGDRVLVDKLTPWFGSEPGRGEVVVFHDPDDWLGGEPAAKSNALQTALGWVGLMPSAGEKDLIKRVIGVGGDTVECKGTGPLTVNGKALNEPYVYPGNTPCSQDGQGGQFKVTVPEGFIWVMGDHRQDSWDSRYHQADKNHGMVPVEEVVGRAMVRAWPVDRWGTLPVPDTFDQQGIGQQPAAAGALTAAPAGVALTAAVPLVIRRRRRTPKAETGTGTGTPTTPTTVIGSR
ncbi:signal peptidase I [Kitasatospora sp. NPDC059646]|uniref:signal peptidase I n=1 Tax=Kitasatospora sp. NPDC059646 TaxID=3346893 RepID=UPI00368C7B98